MADRKISDLTALTTPATGDLIPIVDISEAAAADKNKSITVGELLRGAPDGTAAAPGFAFESDGGNGIFLAGTDQVGIATAGTERVEFGTSEVVFNDGGADVDFRIEGDTNANLFFVDAGNDRVGIGTSSPQNALHAYHATDNAVLRLESGDEYVHIEFKDPTTTNIPYIGAQGDNLRMITGGAAAVTIDSSQRVGIGTTSPGGKLAVFDASAATFRLETPGVIAISHSFDGTDYTINNNDGTNGHPIIFGTKAAGQESARIDASGRLLVGTTTSISGSGHQTFELASGQGGHITLARNDGSVTDGDILGRIRAYGNDGGSYEECGRIEFTADGTHASGDKPTRLVFSTTADGASSPTERMRIDKDGYFKASNDGTYQGSTRHEIRQTAANDGLFMTVTNASYVNYALTVNASRAASSAYRFFDASSGGFADTEFNLRGDGNGYCDGTWSGGGADYAEYFEWSDSNPDAEDRRGISVVLDGDKIREAQPGEDPIGVISGNPSVVGDAAWNKWSGKYLRDEFGTYIQEDYEVTDDDGNTVIQQRRKLNPAYDPDVEYVSREQRPEWDCVGLMGKLRIRKGQLTGSRWIKMRDISDSVEEWLVR